MANYTQGGFGYITFSSNTGTPRETQNAIGSRFGTGNLVELAACTNPGTSPCTGAGASTQIDINSKMNTKMYYTMKRVNGNLSMTAYTDSARTIKFSEISLTYPANAASGYLKYIYTMAPWSDGATGDKTTGSVGSLMICAPNCITNLPQDIYVINNTVNMTSDGGQICGYNNITGSFQYTMCGDTTDTTPTFKFNTVASASCKIATLNANYSSLTASNSWNCTAVGGTAHTCTAGTDQSSLPYGINNLYLSCQAGEYEMTSFIYANGLNISIYNINNKILADSFGLDLTADGTNYGETSVGLASQASRIFNLTPISTARDQILIVRYTELDASLNFYTNNKLIGNIPAVASGSGQWKIKAMRINNTDLQGETYLNITAGTNTATTYLDWIVLADTANDTDFLFKENSWPVLLSNISGSVSSFRGLVFDQNKALLGAYPTTNLSYPLNMDGSGTSHILIYRVPSIDGNYTFNFDANFTGSTYYRGTNYSIEIDSTGPAIGWISTDLNNLVGNNYTIGVNVTERNPLKVNITVNDTAFNPLDISNTANLTSYSTIWNGSLIYTLPYTHIVTITASDKVGHTQAVSFYSRSTNTTYSTTMRDLSTLMSWSNYWNISDSSTKQDLSFISTISITGEGSAYIDEYYQTYPILDDNPINITIRFGDNHLNNTLFNNYNRSLRWLTDYWNNSQVNPQLFNNSVYYTLNNTVTLEWENSGVNDIRLFYLNPGTNFYSISPVTAFVHVPLRTTYSSNSSSINLYECTSGIDWVGKTCAQWSEITTQYYSKGDETYHDGDCTHYPTLDTNNDSIKDTMVLKITLNGEKMYKIDLDGTNSEPAWTCGTTNPPGGNGDNGGSNSGGSSSSGSNTGTNLPSSTTGDKPSGPSIFDKLFGWIGDLWSMFKTQLKIIDWTDPTTITILLGIVIVTSGTLALSRKPRGKTSRTSDLRI